MHRQRNREYFKSHIKPLATGETLVMDGGLLGVDYTLKKESEEAGSINP